MAVLRGVKGHLVPPPLKGLVFGAAGTPGPSPTPTGREVLWSIPEGITHQSEEGSEGMPMLMATTTILTEFLMPAYRRYIDKLRGDPFACQYLMSIQRSSSIPSRGYLNPLLWLLVNVSAVN